MYGHVPFVLNRYLSAKPAQIPNDFDFPPRIFCTKMVDGFLVLIVALNKLTITIIKLEDSEPVTTYAARPCIVNSESSPVCAESRSAFPSPFSGSQAAQSSTPTRLQ